MGCPPIISIFVPLDFPGDGLPGEGVPGVGVGFGVGVGVVLGLPGGGEENILNAVKVNKRY
jgi:hypothetical protein